MKLKAGIKKEDLYDCVFTLHKETGSPKKIQEALFSLGFRWVDSGQAIQDVGDAFVCVLCRNDDTLIFYTYHNKIQKSLSDLIEPEEETPKNLPSDKAEYLRCIDADMERNRLTPFKVYPVVRWIDKTAVVVVNDNNSEMTCNSKRFSVAFEQDYINQQSNIEQEQALSPPERPVGSETDSFLISSVQVAQLSEAFENGWKLRGQGALKKWFPNASCFKEPEKKEERTYKLGDRFKFWSDEYILATLGNKVVGFVNASRGSYWGNAIEVKDLDSITLTELEIMANEYWHNFTEIK